MDAAHQDNTHFLCTYKSNGIFLDNHSNFRKKTGDTTQLNSGGMCQQAQFEHKTAVVNTRIHGRVLQI